MKWIGQHIWSFISRFRNDVYLESVSSGTIASGGNLGLDSNNKIVKADTESGELSFTGSTADGVLTYLDADSIQVESTLTYEGSFQQLTMEGSIAPTFFLKHTADNATDAEIKFYNTKGGAAGDNSDSLGSIVFFGQNNAGSPESIQYGRFTMYIADVTDGSEAGTMEFMLKADGADREGLKMIGSGSSEIIDVEIGHGTTSTTTIEGTLTMGTTAFVNNSGVVQVATQGTIDHDSLANFVANEHIDWTASSAGTIHASNYTNTAGWHGSDTRIKILHSDFIGDDGGRPLMINDAGVGSEQLFLESFSTFTAYATVAIPTGYTATHVMIYGDGSRAVEVWEHQIDSKTGVSKGTGNVDTEINITDVASSATNYLFIQVAQQAGDEIHGGYVTITAS